jgi:nucleoside transporter
MEHAAATEPGVEFRLSVMMFLQYAIWGAWLPILWPYLAGHMHFTPEQIGNLFAIGAVGAIAAPFIAGQLADRFFATQKYVAVSHLIGAVLIWNLASIHSYSGFLWFSLAYSLCYSPTMPLTNSLAFHHLTNRDREFGGVRLWGTIGWIAVGIGVGQWLLHHHTPAGVDAATIEAAQAAGRADAFRLSAVLGVLMGLYCFTLPDTPPARSVERNAFTEAFRAALEQPLLLLFLVSIPVSCIHQFYFVHTSGFLSAYQTGAATMVDSINSVFGVGGGGLMTIGQMTEIAVLGLIPLVAHRVSRKALLLTGLLAYALRMALFAYVTDLPLPPVATLILGVSMHGFAFGCFVFVAFMIVDEETAPDVRASAQSLYNLVLVGIGIIVGSLFSSYVAEQAIGPGGSTLDYSNPAQTRALFSVPMWIAVACFLVILLFYPGGRRRPAAQAVAA